MEPELELLTANALPGTRRETLNGREYIVRNMVLIVPGVLPGSQGPYLYKPEVVGRDVDTWNGMPLVGYHPRVGGKHSTARDPKVLDKQGLGWAFRATYNKQLVAEGWFDVENVKTFDKTLTDDAKLMPRLEGSQPIELSTGLYTIRNARKGKHTDGRDYIGEIENMKPDHVAILPDQVGACSIKDGCGVVVNELSAEHTSKLFLPCEGGWKVFNEGEYKKECDKTMKEKPTKNSLRRMLKVMWNAFCATGAGGGVDPTCGKGDAGGAKGGGAKGGGGGGSGPGTVKAKELRAAIASGKSVTVELGSRKIKGVTALSKGGTKFGGFEVGGHGIGIEGRPTRFDVSAVHKWTTNEASVPDPVPVPISNEVTDMAKKETVTWLTANCSCWKGQEKALENLDEAQLAKLKSDAETTQALLANAAQPKQLTMEEWSKIAPPEVLAVFNAAKAVVEDKKTPLVEALVANCADADKAAMKAIYNKMSTEDLQVLNDKLPKQTVVKRSPVFVGTGAGTTNNNKRPASGPLKRPMPFKDQTIVAKFGAVPSKS